MRIPPGFTQLFPYVVAENGREYIHFMVEALGAEIMSIHAGPDDVVINAHVRFGDTTIMVSDGQSLREPTKGSFYLYVEDADAAVARAIKAGATLKSEPGDRPFGDRQGGVIDPWGNVWWLSQRLVDGPYRLVQAS